MERAREGKGTEGEGRKGRREEKGSLGEFKFGRVCVIGFRGIDIAIQNRNGFYTAEFNLQPSPLLETFKNFLS